MAEAFTTRKKPEAFLQQDNARDNSSYFIIFLDDFGGFCQGEFLDFVSDLKSN
jgi:hypothetical protein